MAFFIFVENQITMKKLFIISFLIYGMAWAQEIQTPKYVYAEIVGQSGFMSKKVSITI